PGGQPMAVADLAAPAAADHAEPQSPTRRCHPTSLAKSFMIPARRSLSPSRLRAGGTGRAGIPAGKSRVLQRLPYRFGGERGWPGERMMQVDIEHAINDLTIGPGYARLEGFYSPEQTEEARRLVYQLAESEPHRTTHFLGNEKVPTQK